MHDSRRAALCNQDILEGLSLRVEAEGDSTGSVHHGLYYSETVRPSDGRAEIGSLDALLVLRVMQLLYAC